PSFRGPVCLPAGRIVSGEGAIGGQPRADGTRKSEWGGYCKHVTAEIMGQFAFRAQSNKSSFHSCFPASEVYTPHTPIATQIPAINRLCAAYQFEKSSEYGRFSSTLANKLLTPKTIKPKRTSPTAAIA